MSRRIRWGVRLALLVGLFAYFAIAGRAFLSTGNLYTLGEGFAMIGIIAIGVAVTMLAGEFDLSIGAIASTGGMIALMAGEDSTWVGVAAGAAFGVTVGLLNGVLVGYLRMQSMVVTVGMLVAVSGLGAELTDGSGEPLDNFDLSAGVVEAIGEVFSIRSLTTLAVIGVVGLVLTWTRIGRDVRAVGSDRRAAAVNGVSEPRVMITVFVFSGLCGGVGGSLLAYSLAYAQADFSGGLNILLPAVTAAVIGGVGLAGGVGTARGVFFGSVTMTVLSNGLGSVAASAAVISLSTGGLLLLIVFLDAQEKALGRRLSERRLLRTRAGP
jgi:ribose/xylose/arabinose/galactoside ABC-type transport system permease subunit